MVAEALNKVLETEDENKLTKADSCEGVVAAMIRQMLNK
jgi:hypothetical protein